MTRQSRKGILPFSIFVVRLYVCVLSFNVLVKIVNFVFVYSGKSVVNVAQPKRYSSRICIARTSSWMFRITLSATTKTGGPIAVPCNCL